MVFPNVSVKQWGVFLSSLQHCILVLGCVNVKLIFTIAVFSKVAYTDFINMCVVKLAELPKVNYVK